MNTAASPQLYEQAFAAFQAGQHAVAAQLCHQLLSQGDHGDAYQLLALCPGTPPVLAIAYLQSALRCTPGHAQYAYNLGVCLAEQGRVPEAAEAYATALRTQPLHGDALNNGVDLLRRSERFEEALALLDRAAALGHAIPAAALHRAICLNGLGRAAEAEPHYRAALLIEPKLPTAAWEFSHLLLAQQRFAEGWQHYNQRFVAPHILGMDHHRSGCPPWRGEALRGKTLLLHAEQGLGDQIMFSSMLHDVLDAGARVVLDLHPSLRSLWQHSFPEVAWVEHAPASAPSASTAGAAPHSNNTAQPEPVQQLQAAYAALKPAPDFECGIGDLAVVFRTHLEDFAPQPYLRVLPELSKQWAQRVEAAVKLTQVGADRPKRIGIVWSTNPARGLFSASRRANRKSMPLADLLQALPHSGYEWISLHNQSPDMQELGADGVQRPALDQIPQYAHFHDFSSHLHNFADTAALASCCDAVLVVDTAVAHLCGALGLKCAVFLPAKPDWRWCDAGERSYWYADMTLLRQTHEHDWRQTYAQAKQWLAAL